MNTSRLLFMADDDVDDIFIFRMALSEVDPSVKLITAQDGVEAMIKLRHPLASVPDFIFLDLNMPRKSGKECIEEIRKEIRLKDIPIIIYSTTSSDLERKETLQLGATAFMMKFYRLKDLCHALQKLLNNYSLAVSY